MYLVTGERLCLWTANWQWMVWSYLDGAWQGGNPSPLICWTCVLCPNKGECRLIPYLHRSPTTSRCDPWIKTKAKKVGTQVIQVSFSPVAHDACTPVGSNDCFDRAPCRDNRRRRMPSNLPAAYHASTDCSLALKDLILADKPLFVQGVVIVVYKQGDWDNWCDSWSSRLGVLWLSWRCHRDGVSLLPTLPHLAAASENPCEGRMHPWLCFRCAV